MERVLTAVCMDDQEPVNLNDHMAPAFVACDAANGTLTTELQVKSWQANPAGTLHGGALAAGIDLTCGCLIRYYTGDSRVVTTNLNINYIRGVEMGEHFRITATVDKAGRRLKFLHAVVTDEAAGRLIATATAQFIVNLNFLNI